MTLAAKLPLCNNNTNGHLACLRPAKGIQCPSHLPPSPLPLRPLENKLPLTPNSCFSKPGDGLSPNFSSTPFITVRRHQLDQLQTCMKCCILLYRENMVQHINMFLLAFVHCAYMVQHIHLSNVLLLVFAAAFLLLGLGNRMHLHIFSMCTS